MAGLDISALTSLITKLNLYIRLKNLDNVSRYQFQWKQEKRLLKWAHNYKWQGLDEWLDAEDIVSLFGRSEISDDQIDRLVGNLFFKGYIDVSEFHVFHKNTDSQAYRAILLNKDKDRVLNFNYSYRCDHKENTVTRWDGNEPEGTSPDISFFNYQFRPTALGLELGEVIDEVENDNYLVSLAHNYKYILIISLLALVTIIFFSNQLLPSTEFLSSTLKVTPEVNFICGLLAVLLLVPLLTFVIGKILRELKGVDKFEYNDPNYRDENFKLK